MVIIVNVDVLSKKQFEMAEIINIVNIIERFQKNKNIFDTNETFVYKFPEVVTLAHLTKTIITFQVLHRPI